MYEVAGVCDPAPGGELLEQGPVQPARGQKVDIVDGSAGVAELGGAHPGLEPAGIAAGDLAINQQAGNWGRLRSAVASYICNSRNASAMPSSRKARFRQKHRLPYRRDMVRHQAGLRLEGRRGSASMRRAVSSL